MAETPLVEARNLCRYFGSGHTQVRAVDDVSLEIARGELVLIMGPSGSGKTTLVSMLGGLLAPSRGRIWIDGTEITDARQSDLPAIRARSIGFIFQAFNLLDALTVEENVLFPAQLIPGGIAGARSRADGLIERLGLSERRRARPNTLSGGEKQRVAIARALINQPPLILADEPTGNLDSQTGQEVMMLLWEIARDAGCAVVLVTHDRRVEEISDRVLWLEDGALRDRKTEPHVWLRDPVCGMRVDAWTAAHVLEIAGDKLAFCSAGCRERFVADPDRYPIVRESP